MLRKLSFVVPLVVLISLIFSVKVFAAEDFDAEYYANKYPDVVEVLGTNPDVLYNHYVVYGKNEGRFKNLNEEINRISENNILYPTYIDVDIDNQVVRYYENGVLILEDVCVTGNESTNHSTPRGTFTIMTHTNGKRLKGPTWNVWVDYWMRFTDSACGFHDATWRSDSEFGGDTYKNNGSHGCVNLKHEFAKELYDYINIGTIVVVH